MDTKVIPYPLVDNPFDSQVTVNQQVIITFAEYAVQVLAKTGRSSKVVAQGTPPPMPFVRNGWELKPVTDEYTLPFEVQRRINILRNKHIPIKQILIAHDITPELKRLKRENRRLLQRQKRAKQLKDVAHTLSPYLKTLATIVGTIIVAVITAPLLLLLLQAILQAMIGLITGIAVLAGLALMGSGVDPIVLCLLDDSVQSWIQIGMWYE